MAREVKFPALQVAFDLTSWREALSLARRLEPLMGPRLILEAGTPLIKSEGMSAVALLSAASRGSPVAADLKTMDTAELEVELAAEAGADAAVVSGAAPAETVEIFSRECRRRGLLSYADSIGVDDAERVAAKAREADVIVLHRGIDEETSGKASPWPAAGLLRRMGFRVAVAGGVTPELAARALEAGADIIIVGRDVTKSQDPLRRAEEYLKLLSGRG